MSTDERPRVSVVVATRSRPELLRATLRSVFAQDYPGEIEAVVVYDQSEPESGLAADLTLSGHDGPRTVRIITNTRTPGLAGARNSGVAASTGDVLAFCDDDDTWLPAKTSGQLARLDAERAGLSVCGIVIEFGDREHTRVPRPEDITVEQLARRRVMEAHPSTVVVRREAFDRIGWIDEELPGSYAEDYDWMLRAVGAERVAVVSEPLVRVLWHPGSFFSTRWATIIAALDYLVDKHAAIRDSPRGLGRIYGQKAFAYAALHQRGDAAKWAWRAIRLAPAERRGYLALVVSTGLLPAHRVLSWANSRGRGI